ncbi:DUF2062 domain-containing protein [Thioalkalicoccus limnaeus]|uniref:DUF2062 domain-containing protein n=1 Tax=Thioalkalicoccus limnaeus TaxID=120681 RepID=A0ABV4BB51_9GAMM
MKRWLTRILPHPKTLRDNRYLRLFGKLLHDPNLWHLNRRSVAGGVAVGGFFMFIPPIGQMPFAAATAILFRVNLPISVALVWLSNPLTMPVIYYAAYRIGARLLGHPPIGFRAEFWADYHNWLGFLGPLMLGSLVCAVLCSGLGYLSVQTIWRWHLRRQIKERRRRFQALASLRLRTPSSNDKT